MFHALPNLRLLHRVHHADRDFDVTTGLRFLPSEIILLMGIKIAAIALDGPWILMLPFSNRENDASPSSGSTTG